MKYNYNGVWKDINIKVADTLPVGTIIPFGGTLIPANYRECDGSTLSRTEYALLFAAIGTSFGEGDGSTTFNLPDLRGKVPVGLDLEDTDFDTIGETGGEKEHTLTIDEMPSHNHGLPSVYGDFQGDHKTMPSETYQWFNKTRETANTGGGQPHNIMQPYQIVKYIIKVLDAPASGIRSETLPVGTEVDFDGVATDIPTGWQQINDPESYSTNEVKTNKTWINGKPIYRKIITTICDGSTTFSINHNISDLEEVTELNYHIFASSTNTTDAFLNSNHVFRVNRVTSTVISGMSSSGYDNNWQSRITLEYTKTTDQGGNS